MNTKISVTKSYKSKDNLIVLADYEALGWASTLLNKSEIQFLNSAAKNEVAHIFMPQGERAIIVQFLRDNEEEVYTREEARLAGSEALSLLSHYKIPSVTVVNKRKANRVIDFVEGMVLSNYQFLKYFKDKKEKANPLKEVKVELNSTNRKEIAELIAVIEATCKARDLVNEPQSYLSAVKLSDEIKAIAKKSGFEVEVFDKKKIQSLKMGGILAVNMGSVKPPRFNILTWKHPKAKNKRPVILVGKGIVYDTGGMSLKSTPNSMDMMKCDMAGAATVIGTVSAVAKANLPLHIIGLVPSTDNRPGKDAYVPGDVITMYDGSTVEVMNTDAEGRLVLADALQYAKKYKPELVMDFATLTGSAVRATGPEAICFMGNAKSDLKNKMVDSGNAVYERLIEFPLWKEYGEHLKSNIADLRNLGNSNAGMITAGKFLEHFTNYPWMHFDIAGPAFIKSADAYRSKEGTGVGVRLLFNFLKNY